MTTDGSADTVAPVAVAPTALPYLVRERIFLYLGILIVLLAFGSPAGGLIDIPISFLLKNKLHLQAHELADFRPRVRHPPLPVICFRIRSRHLESVWDERPRIHAVVRHSDSWPLRPICLHSHHICHTSCCSHAVDYFVPFCRKRSERLDFNTWAAACDVRSDQRGVEHLRLDPDRRGSPHRAAL